MCVASIALAFLVFVVCICCFDVPCPRLGRDLGVAVGDVVAIAEKFCDKGRWDFYGQALRRGVACSQQVDTQIAQSLHGWVPCWRAALRHSDVLAVMPDEARRAQAVDCLPRQRFPPIGTGE